MRRAHVEADVLVGCDGIHSVVRFPERLPTLKEAEEVLSEALITEALGRADGNQGAAAGLLGISWQALI